MNSKSNIEAIQNEIKNFNTRLIAVSKTHPIEKIQEAYNAGQRLFGESKVQELIEKKAQLPPDIEWHFIGHLQRNKVKQLLPMVSVIHSIDSESLLQEIEKQATKNNQHVQGLLQVHIAQEETKFGLSEEEVRTLIQKISAGQFPHVRIIGLMGMATNTDDEQKIRQEFRQLKMLFDSLQNQASDFLVMNELSMGMSSDYRIAIEEGSTLIRVGSLIFGSR